jgi:hypothetical protein
MRFLSGFFYGVISGVVLTVGGGTAALLWLRASEPNEPDDEAPATSALSRHAASAHAIEDARRRGQIEAYRDAARRLEKEGNKQWAENLYDLAARMERNLAYA